MESVSRSCSIHRKLGISSILKYDQTLVLAEYCNGILRDLWTQFRVKETTQEPNNEMF